MMADVLKERSVLLVDDDPRNRFALRSYLEGMALKTYASENGFQAIALLAEGVGIDIILMDMMMPGMDGYEAIGRIRNNPATSGIPIIAVTAKAMKGDREKCLAAGASEYVSKPIQMTELFEKMAVLLDPAP
jgi:two-component system chemotaxis sensor kinase CheA